MIPKNIFFIWTSEPKSPTKILPAFGKYAVNKFKEINPNFNIIEFDDNSKEVIECKNLFLKLNVKSPCGLFNEWLRLYVIFKYGGIYLDYDCFPVKPFDEYIQKFDYITSKNDIFALASCKRNVNTITQSAFSKFSNNQGYFPNYNYFINPTYRNGAYAKNFNKNNCIKLKDKFWDCSLQIGEKIEPNSTDPMYYFDHYRMSIWNTKNVSIRNSSEMMKLK